MVEGCNNQKPCSGFADASEELMIHSVQMELENLGKHRRNIIAHYCESHDPDDTAILHTIKEMNEAK